MENVTLISTDSQEFTITRNVAEMSATIKNLIEDTGTSNKIPIPNVTGAILTKIIEYCQHHIEHAEDPNIKEWDQTFVDIEQDALFQLILAVNYLDIHSLLDLGCKKVADRMKGKTTEELREMYNIKNDFSPEEEEQIRKENEWCENK